MTFGSIEVTIPDDIQEPIPPIRLSGSNDKGVTIAVTWPNCGPVSMAYLEANDASGSRLGDVWKPSGIDQDNGTATWRPTTAQLSRLLGTSGAYLALKLEDENGTILVTRRFAIVVEDPVITAASVESEGLLLDLRKSAATAAQAKQDAADAEATFDKAVQDGKATMNEAISDFNTKGDQAIEADTARVTALIDGTSIDAASHEVTPATPPSVAKTGTGTQATFDFALPRAPHVDATAESTDANAANVSASTDGAGDVTLNFTLPRARNVSATATAGTEAAVSQTADANGDVMLAFTLPRGEKGEKGDTGPQGPAGGPKGDKGDKGDPGESTPIATTATAGKVKPGNGLGVEPGGTLTSLIASGIHVYQGSYQASVGTKIGYKSELSPQPTDDDPPRIGDLIVLPDKRIGVINYVNTGDEWAYYGIGGYWSLGGGAIPIRLTRITLQDTSDATKTFQCDVFPIGAGAIDINGFGNVFSPAVAVVEKSGISKYMPKYSFTVASFELEARGTKEADNLKAYLEDCDRVYIAGEVDVQGDGSSVKSIEYGQYKDSVVITPTTPLVCYPLGAATSNLLMLQFYCSNYHTQAAEIEKSAASLQTLGYDEPAITARLADTGYTVSFDGGKPTATPTAQVDPPAAGGPTVGGLS